MTCEFTYDGKPMSVGQRISVWPLTFKVLSLPTKEAPKARILILSNASDPSAVGEAEADFSKILKAALS